MKNEEFEIELRISVTGEVWSAEISRETTVKQIIDGFMTVHNLDPKLGLGWELLHKGQVLGSDVLISELIDNNSPATFELIAKVQGG